MSSSPRTPRTRALIGLVAAAAAVSLALSGCTPKAAAAGQPAASPTTTASATGPSALPLHLVVPAAQSPTKAMAVAVAGGVMTSVAVTNHTGGMQLGGKVKTGGKSWSSIGLPYPGATYDIAAAVTDSNGQAQTLKASVRVGTLASSSTVGFTVTPAAGQIVGVNAPIVLRFYKPIKDKPAVERALVVFSSTPVVGAWHWFGSQEVHFRPQTTWPARSQVRLVAVLKGVRVGLTLFGQASTAVDFTVGDAHVTRVDGKKHTLTLYVSGKKYATWPTSLGRPEFATRSGNYIILLKQPTRRMTSCHANITCDPKNPNFYDLTVNWDSRLTWSGTFIHSAPWSVGSQGRSNVSHGCINLSPSHAISYYKLAQYGDLVTVTGTIRNADDLVASGDPGMTDWNTTWTAWVAGSALHAPVTTVPIPVG